MNCRWTDQPNKRGGQAEWSRAIDGLTDRQFDVVVHPAWYCVPPLAAKKYNIIFSRFRDKLRLSNRLSTPVVSLCP